MARDPKKVEKAVMKKRRKQKQAAPKKHLSALSTLSPHALIRRARTFPIIECLISRDWQLDTTQLTQIVVAREQPNQGVVFGVYLLDRACLGLKNTFCNADFSLARYRQELVQKVASATPLEKCPPELAHQIIYQSIDYAAQFGFKPQKDFKLAQFVLEPRGVLPEPYALTFGKNGKPFFVAGPYDNVQAILAKLEATAGPDNYVYVVPFNPG
jgi:hypothetical protein